MSLFRWGVVLAAAAILFSIAALWTISEPTPLFSSSASRLRPGDAARGQLVFAAGDCASCHATPGQSDRLKLGGGLALASPYGTFRVPNISQHLVDGIGSWSVTDFANALVSGVSPKSEHYYPAFPYTSYTGMRIADIQDLYAYFKTLPPVAGKPPPHDLYFFARIRRLVGLWKAMFFHERKIEGRFDGDPVHDRGAYLVEAVAHCAECHSTRNIFGAIVSETRFAGGKDPEGTGFIPNITPERIGKWSAADIAKVLKSGHTPDHGRVGSSMTGVVTNTAMLPQSDRDAIAAYIKSLPARQTPKP
jgi:mono/diheme cytochrome c family protein